MITCLGAFSAAYSSLGPVYNSTAVGYGSFAQVNNEVIFGNGSIQYIGGYASWSTYSDCRMKKNIEQNVPGLAFINKLRPVTYNYNLDAEDAIIRRPQIKDRDGKVIQPSAFEIEARTEKQQIVYTGFIAQEVEKAANDLNYDFSGIAKPKDPSKQIYSLRYSEFVVPLVKAVQELSSQNEKLKEMQQCFHQVHTITFCM